MRPEVCHSLPRQGCSDQRESYRDQRAQFPEFCRAKCHGIAAYSGGEFSAAKEWLGCLCAELLLRPHPGPDRHSGEVRWQVVPRRELDLGFVPERLLEMLGFLFLPLSFDRSL